MTYESPQRPQSHRWRAGIAWWRSLDPDTRLTLRQRYRLTSAALIVAYHGALA